MNSEKFLSILVLLFAVFLIYVYNPRPAEPEYIVLDVPVSPLGVTVDFLQADEWPEYDPERDQRPVILVPPDVENIALGKRVTGSEPEGHHLIGEYWYVTDGIVSSGEPYYIEMSEGLQYITIDLETRHRIYAIALWHYFKRRTYYHDVIIQIADSSAFINTVIVFNNDKDNSTGFGKGTDEEYGETNGGKVVDTRGICGRYVRLYSNGSTMNPLNHYVEVEVYGKPLE